MSMIINNDDNTAYCCQCSWVNAKDEIEINTNNNNSTNTNGHNNPKWVCAGHYDK